MAGHRLARALTNVVADTIVKVRSGLLRPEQEAVAHRHRRQMEHFETELAERARVAFGPMMEHPDVPQELKDVLGPLFMPEHQTDLFLLIPAFFGLMLTIGPAAAAPWAQAVRQAMFRKDPNTQLDVDTYIGLAARYRDYVGIAEHELMSWGINQDQMTRGIEAARTPPDVGTIMTLRRRGILSDDQVTEALHQSGLHPMWINQVQQLEVGPPPVGDMVMAAVQGHVSQDDLGTVLRQHGIDPGWRDTMYATAGRPPGIQELIGLWNRGVIGEATVEQAIRESDIKDKYIPAIKEFRVYLPPPRSIVPMMHSGAISVERGRELLMEHGLRAEDAEAFVREATLTKTAAQKHATASLITTMYQDYELDRPTTERLLRNLSFDDESIVLELGRAEALRGKKIRDAAVSRVRAQYDRRRISRQDASNALDRAGVPTQARDQMLSTWDVERLVSAPQMTAAQWGQAFKKGVIGDTELQEGILSLGYSNHDTRIIMGIHGATAQGI